MSERTGSRTVSYGPYGSESSSESNAVIMFSGYWRDVPTSNYMLGNGYRMFNPLLMRFHSPDELSPFAAGGINAYMYCSGDPVNKTDASGRAGTGLTALLKQHGLPKKHVKPLFKMLKPHEDRVFELIRVDKENATTFHLKSTSAGYSVEVSSTGRTQDQLHPGTYLNKKDLYVAWRAGARSNAISSTTGFKEITVRPHLPTVTLEGPSTNLAQDNAYVISPLTTVVQGVRAGGHGADVSGVSQNASTSRR